MPKERRDRSVSISKSTFSPYRCSTGQTKQSLVNNSLENEKSFKEWDEARCPICMEHPHNAILLLCSSHNNGCRPYMCDTSYRHTNCFDQFRKSFSKSQLSGPSTEQSQQRSSLTGESQPSLATGHDEKSKLVCPLCRGLVNGWVVVDPARLFMNMKARSCASEMCDFSGTYAELRKHARLVHPFIRPSEVDPMRERVWRRMEMRRDLGDLFSSLQSSIGEEQDEVGTDDLSFDDRGWLTIFFLIRVFRSGNSSWSGSNGDVDAELSNSEPGLELGSLSWFQLSGRRPAPDDDDGES